MELVARKDGREALLGVAKELSSLQRMQRVADGSSAIPADAAASDYSVQTDENPPRHVSFAAEQVVTIGGCKLSSLLKSISF